MVSTISIRVTGDKEVQMYLAKIQRDTPIEGERLTEELCREMVAYAKEKVSPLNTGSGKLRDSIRYYKEGKVWVVNAGEGVVNKSGKHYAQYQEYGYTPHYVSVNSLGPGKLRNTMRSAGVRKIFVSQYFPYMSKARRKVLSGIDTKMNRTAEKIIR